MFSLVRKTRNGKREPESHCSLHRWHRSQRLLPVARASPATDCRGGHSSALEQIIQYISPSSVVLDYTYHVTILTKMLHTHTELGFFSVFQLNKDSPYIPIFFLSFLLAFQLLFVVHSIDIYWISTICCSVRDWDRKNNKTHRFFFKGGRKCKQILMR